MKKLAPIIGLGCMRMASLNDKEAEKIIKVAIENGINFFDHADIYGKGTSEEIFARAVKNGNIKREDMIIQSKCGICKGYYDSSKEHILESVDGILKRLNMDYIDSLLLHRPDALIEPEEVAEAFDELKKSGKVKYFGVSNAKTMQIELLSKYVRQDIMFNQLQFSITNANMISNGINVNMENEYATERDGSVLDYCRLKNITIQPWSPFQYGTFAGTFIGSDKFPELNKKLLELSDKYKVSTNAIAIAWILRHPANMQPIVGTMNAKRLEEISFASTIELTRIEWYEIYRAAGNMLP